MVNVLPQDPMQNQVPAQAPARQGLPPEFFMTLGGGILSGNGLGDGLGRGLTNASTVLASQREKMEAQQKQSATYEALKRIDPEKAELFKSGVLGGTDAYKLMLDERAKREAASKPDYEWKVINNKLVRINKNAAENPVQEVGDFSEPKLPAIAEEYNWAKENGFDGTPQEYQMWKANLSKQKGMIIESTPEGGFRMVQGDVDTAKMPKLTEAEGKNAGFLKRALSAEKELSALEGEGTSLWNKGADLVPVLGNYAKSDSAQKFDQAQRNFINAVLRRESGAVISPEEFDNARKQYFPQPGDGADVIAQKRKNREDAIAGFEIGSGPAATRIQEMDANEQQQADPLGIR